MPGLGACPGAASHGAVERGGNCPVTSERADRVQAVVIGGGVVGCAVLRELSVRGIKAILLEAEPDVCEGTSKANSAIVATGFDARPGTIEARLLRRASELWPELLDELAVPFLAVGALMLARTPYERDTLAHTVRPVATSLGVATELLDGSELRSIAPYVSPEAIAALHVPAEAIIDPFWLTRAYADAAVGLGARVWTGARVTAIDVGFDRIELGLSDGRRIVAEQAFDCAGLFADDVARLAGDATFDLRPRKGQFLVSEKTFGVDRIIVPLPGPLGKGMLVTPIVFGGVLLGPTAEDLDDKLDNATDVAGRRRIMESCIALVPAVEEMEPIRQFAGLRAVSSTGDYILRPSSAGDRLFVVAGIRSTGISASAAIAEAVVDDVVGRRSWSGRLSRRGPAPATEWAQEAGSIVCVCRSIAGAEVEAALQQPTSSCTTDGLKRRCGVGFGDCQGNLCLAELVGRIAATGCGAVTSIRKGPQGSWLIAGDARPSTRSISGGDRGAERPPDGYHVPGPVDVVVVGAGLAGIGVALSAVGEPGRGANVVVVDRGTRFGGATASLPLEVLTRAEREAVSAMAEVVDRGRVRFLPSATVVGLIQQADGRWQVQVQTAVGTLDLDSRQVVLASGGYVTPREHLAIDGPRPSGVMTADFALAALDRGWLPARRAVVVGSGRLARGLVARLEAAGTEIVERVETQPDRPAGTDAGLPVRAISGVARLDGVRVGDRWLEVDGLILAHALRPATFLLRGLGIGDERPGVAAPVAADGSLSLAGLWAVGTCVEPDVDHGASLAAGLDLGARLDVVTGTRTRDA